MTAELWFWIATAASVTTLIVHTFVGGARVARPLLADETLPRAAKWLAYYCWHIVTLLLLYMSVAFGLVAARLAPKELAIFIAVNAASFSVLSAVVALKGSIAPYRFPSTSLFLIIAIAAVAGTLA
jgi:hypothetical protein